MENKNEIQDQDFILPGNLGTAKIGSTGKVSNITKLVKHNDSAVTITLSEVVDHYLNGVPITEDADYEVVQPLLIENKNDKI